jgi:hypothetical protein
MAYDVKKPGHKPAGKPIPADRIAECERITKEISKESERVLRDTVAEFGPALRSLAGK